MAGLIMDIVLVDHCYSKPWSAHPDASNARPLKTIYMKKFPRGNSEIPKIEPEPVVDVINVQPNIPHYDVSKAKVIMNECEKHVSSLREETDWEELINKSGWSPQQIWLANKAIKILHGDRLSRLAYENNINEPVLRRIHVDKAAKRFRQALSSVTWDTRLTQWLHGVLMDNLGVQYLATYLDILQTLRAKIPQLIDRMMLYSGTKPRAPNLSGEPLINLVKRPWDPVFNSYSQNKMRKLPFNPLILVAPSGPTTNTSLQSKRMRYYTSQFSSLGKVIPVTMHTVNGGSGVSIAQCLEHMIGAVKTKVVELKGDFANRPIVLMGWNIGALVSCHVALQESVSAVVCLGFPFTGVGGGRGDADDPLLESRTPTLFVIGQHATTCTIDEMEDLREKMKADNSLLVVGGADDHLRVCRAKKKKEGLTQIMVDKSILDEVSEFLGGILSQGPIVHESVIVDLSEMEVKKKRKYPTEVMDSIDLTATNPTVQGSTQNMTIANALRAQALASTVPLISQNKIPAIQLAGTSSVTSPIRGKGSTQNMTIANALRAQALASTVPLISQNKIPAIQLAGTSSVTSPIRVKRKYTKRKGVNKPVNAAPRKRFKSTPAQQVASPVTPNLHTPLSAGLPLSSQPGTPDLTGLLKPQGLLPLLDTVIQKPATVPTAKVSQPTTNFNLPSPSILSAGNEPMITYRLEDYQKRFGQPDTSPTKPTISIEGLLQTPGPSYLPDLTPSFLQLGRQRPQVHVTTASSVTSHIHQLLANMSKSTGLTGLPTSALPSVAHLSTPPKTTPQPETVTSQVNLNPTQLSQSGSPLQNSVPTLMSSLNKSSGYNIGNMIKIITSTAAASQGGNLKLSFEESQPTQGHKLSQEELPSIVSSAVASSLPKSDNPNPILTTLPDCSTAGDKLSPAVEQSGKVVKSAGESTHRMSKTDEVFSHMISSIAAAKNIPKTALSFTQEGQMPPTQHPLYSARIRDSQERVLSSGQGQDLTLSKSQDLTLSKGQDLTLSKGQDITLSKGQDMTSKGQSTLESNLVEGQIRKRENENLSESQTEIIIDLTLPKGQSNINQVVSKGQGQISQDIAKDQGQINQDVAKGQGQINQDVAKTQSQSQSGHDIASSSQCDQSIRQTSSTPSEETLGQVSSLLESSPVTEKPMMASVGTDAPVLSRSHGNLGNQAVNVPMVTGFPQKPPAIRHASPGITSYTATPKQSLATLAATRTRRIRTPKQYDL